ncbi:MAG: hypothetical protein PCFJNLEI_00790 [Verrucomicrobiae bacterium]|nr:hypothetical protein [Verrucomicrobiae bacterium]
MILARWLLLWIAAGMAHTGAATLRIMPQGERLAGPQLYADAAFDFVDWNHDGVLDLYMPHGSMINVAVHLNAGTKTEPRLGFSLWYTLNVTETVPYGLYFTQAHILGDLNSDGLWDIVYYDGQFRMAYNTGTRHGPNHWNLAGKAPYFPGSPQFIKENTRITVAPESMYFGKGVFPRQVLTATLADWDRDGLLDLIVCRFKEEAPGVGPPSRDLPLLPASVTARPTWLEKLDAAPARELVFYKNMGTKEKPWFDTGVEITTGDGQSIAAPNPVVVDLDGDGLLDIASTETTYRCNAYRVDWPTNPHVMWFKGRGVARVEPARAVVDAAGKPIPAGTQARLVDYRGVGAPDLFVLEPASGLRWYQKEAKGFAAPRVVNGSDFARFGMMYQPVVTDWTAPGSRDLLLHGETDVHCQWGYRRTALYRNVATHPGELRYEFAGNFTYLGDPMMIPHQYPFQDWQNELFGSKIAVLPPDSTGRQRIVMSVGGRLWMFRNLAADGLTFQERVPLNIPNPGRNRQQGWQDIPVNVTEKVRHIRLSNNLGGLGLARDGLLHIVNFEALAGGKNVATVDQGATVKASPAVCKLPTAMITPGNQINDTAPTFTSFGRAHGPAVVTLKEPVTLEKIRFRLADREPGWYTAQWGLSWQGKRVRQSPEIGEVWFHYKVEVSADGQNWTVVTDRLKSEMNRSTPVFVDWNQDGKLDLVLGVLNEEGITAADTEYRLYLNQGTNDDPKFTEYRSLCDENGQPIRLRRADRLATTHSDLAVIDRRGDGSVYDLVVEDVGNFNGLRFYENVSADPQKEPRFKFTKLLGDGLPISYTAPRLAFTMADIDGDGVTDLLHFTGCIWFFKGIAAGAPAVVADLRVSAVDKATVTVQWTRPKGATRYELRRALAAAFREWDWSGLPAVTGEYTAAEGATQTARLPLPADGQVWSVGVKSQTAKGEFSARSNWAEAIAAPWTRVVLRNGPAGAPGELDYTGAHAVMIDAETPTQQPAVGRGKLQVYMRTSNKNTMILLRFADLPRLSQLERATLELTTDPQLLSSLRLLAPAQVDLTCSAIRDDWDVDKVTFAEAAPGKPWAAGELAAGGKFQDLVRPLTPVTARQVVRWDVTAAVRAAIQAGRRSVSLLVRGEHNGPYSAAEEWSFVRPNFQNVNQRPRLCLIGK